MVDKSSSFYRAPVLQVCPFGVRLQYGSERPEVRLVGDIHKAALHLHGDLPRGERDAFVDTMMTQWRSAGEANPHAFGLLGRKYAVQLKLVAQGRGDPCPVLEVVNLPEAGKTLSPMEEVAQSNRTHRELANALEKPVALMHAAILVPHYNDGSGDMIVDAKALHGAIASATVAVCGAAHYPQPVTKQMLTHGEPVVSLPVAETDTQVTIGIHNFGRTLAEIRGADDHVTMAMFTLREQDRYDVLTDRTPSRIGGNPCVQIRVRPTINGHEGAEQLALKLATQILLRLS